MSTDDCQTNDVKSEKDSTKDSKKILRGIKGVVTGINYQTSFRGSSKDRTKGFKKVGGE